MNRYFLYLILLNMLNSVIVFVPKILIEHRYNGAVSGILVAIPIGLSLTVLYCNAITRFPEQGIPEILAKSVRWLKVLHLGSIQFFWYSGGLIALIGIVDILSRFVNPEMPKFLILSIYLAAILLIIQLPTERVMYLLEIVLFLNTPLIMFLIVKAFTSEFLSWDSILEVCTHLFERPSLTSIATATYVFTGYVNLIIFNRVIKAKLKIWNFIIILFMGIFNLFTTFFIPIGLKGSDGAEEYLYPWISSADSLRLVYSPVERVIYVFLMFYMSISIMGISVHWHVALELVKGSFKKKASNKKSWLIITMFSVVALGGVLFINTVLLNKITVVWMLIRFGSEIIIVMIFFLWARRKTA